MIKNVHNEQRPLVGYIYMVYFHARDSECLMHLCRETAPCAIRRYLM
jgi:hypothetical protein